MMDTVGNKAARTEIAMIKVAVPSMACKVINYAIQAFGGAGVTNDYGLAAALCDRASSCALQTVPTKSIVARLAAGSFSVMPTRLP